ncbi:MAG: hypothetical protein MSA09_09755 [Lachnospiraceae bacterium]|nr:hypothetical protein [Lachnospiraceae bacterium]
MIFMDISNEEKYIVKNIILQYGAYESWKLSELSHKEISWRNSRKGIPEGHNGSRIIKLEDIRKDAEKVRPYDSVWDMYYDEFDDAEGLVDVIAKMEVFQKSVIDNAL